MVPAAQDKPAALHEPWPHLTAATVLSVVRVIYFRNDSCFSRWISRAESLSKNGTNYRRSPRIADVPIESQTAVILELLMTCVWTGERLADKISVTLQAFSYTTVGLKPQSLGQGGDDKSNRSHYLLKLVVYSLS